EAQLTERSFHREKAASIIEILRYRADVQSEHVAYTFLRSGDQRASLTYGVLDLKVRAIASLLQSQLPRGSRLLLAYQPGLDFVLAFWACLYAGMVAVPAYAPRRNQKVSRLRSIVANAEIEFALTTVRSEATFKRFCCEDSVLSQLRWLVTDQVADSWAAQWQPPALSPNTLAFLQYTSGSTGEPKGVMVSHDNLMHNSSVIAQCFGHTAEKSVGLIWLPPYHDMGLIGGIVQPPFTGFPVYLMSPIDFLQKPLRWLQAISRYRITTSGGPNFAYELAIRKATPERLESLDLSCWEVAFTGAEPIRAETLDRFIDVFAPYGFRREALYPCYGMAESTLIISGGAKQSPPVVRQFKKSALEQNSVESVDLAHSDAQSDVHNRVRSDVQRVVGCGQSVPGQSVIVVDTERLSPCSNGQIGEIWVSGRSVAQGYWNQPQETAACFQASLTDSDGKSLQGPFMRTGDLGFLDKCELFVTGRLKDLLIIRGQNHYPQDLELTVARSHLALRPNAGAAFSIDLNREERLVIVHEVVRGYLRSLSVEEVLRCIRQAVTAEHSLEVYAIALVKTGSIPKTSSGKIRRFACKRAFLKGELNVVADWSRNPRQKASFQTLQSQIETIFQEIHQEAGP
ncbi:MAG: fatty acyl-AMP ligase, partial [Cyanobacteria bacterium P01_C01_bin.69]